jgi:cytochrome bd-type quinol oxidase subunit 2
MTLTETLVSGLIMSIVTGLAWLAYRHNHAFRKLFPWLYGATLVAAACFMSFTMGISFAQSKKDLSPNSIPIFMLVFLLVNAYLGFLYWLPNLLKKNEKNGKPE